MSFAWWHILILLLPMLPTFWSIWHICRHPFADETKKMLWLLVVVFLPVIGGIIYIAFGRGQALSSTGSGNGHASDNDRNRIDR